MARKNKSDEVFEEALDRGFFVCSPTIAHNCVHGWQYLYHDDDDAAWFCDEATQKFLIKMPPRNQKYTGPKEVEDHLFEDNVIPFPCARSPQCDS